jgi:hypothetical protein
MQQTILIPEMDLLYHIVTSPTSNWAMPHKKFRTVCKLKHIHIETLAEIYIYNLKQTNTFKCTDSYRNNNKNTHATHTGKTHKNKRINNNATCNLTQNGHLSW